MVRDRISEIIENDGEVPVTHIAGEVEYEAALASKLHEEVAKFLDNPSVEEAADILEVLHAICDLNEVSLSQLENISQEKAEERGGFSQRIILERTERD